MPKLDLDSVPQVCATTYPQPFAADMDRRFIRRIAEATGLTDFGISQVELEPGGLSSQRHWHEDEDEFVVMLDGEAMLVEEGRETPMRPGDCAVFPKGAANGHRLVNRSDRRCAFLAFGRTTEGTCHYPDVDLRWDGTGQRYTRKDGTPY